MRQPFLRHTGKVAVLPRDDVDTDQIIPKHFLKGVERTGFGPHLFHDWRYRADGSLDPGFELNRPQAAGASILLTGANFGCGSSREHAVWALGEFGFRAVIAPSFADIFFANCCQNGIVPVRLPNAAVAEIQVRWRRDPEGWRLTVDLETSRVYDSEGFEAAFHINGYQRELLLLALDPIAMTELHESAIASFERRRTAPPR